MTKEEAIKILRHWGSNTPAIDRDCAVKMAIEALEKPEPHWIPVTEATPTEDNEYWCTFGVETGWFVDWCDWYQGRWVVWTDNAVSEVRYVIAWCKPLEPYKGVTE